VTCSTGSLELDQLEIEKRFLAIKQGPAETLIAFKDRYQQLLDQLEAVGIDLPKEVKQVALLARGISNSLSPYVTEFFNRAHWQATSVFNPQSVAELFEAVTNYWVENDTHKHDSAPAIVPIAQSFMASAGGRGGQGRGGRGRGGRGRGGNSSNISSPHGGHQTKDDAGPAESKARGGKSGKFAAAVPCTVCAMLGETLIGGVTGQTSTVASVS
jgi:hypothetical protein